MNKVRKLSYIFFFIIAIVLINSTLVNAIEFTGTIADIKGTQDAFDIFLKEHPHIIFRISKKDYNKETLKITAEMRKNLRNGEIRSFTPRGMKVLLDCILLEAEPKPIYLIKSMNNISDVMRQTERLYRLEDLDRLK